MSYVNGMVAAVPTANKDAYFKMCKVMSGIFKRHGAIQAVDCWGDDVPDGEVTSLPMAVKCKPDETGAFAWIIWPDKATAEAGMQAAMADPEMSLAGEMPFDGKRLIYGGFETLT